MTPSVDAGTQTSGPRAAVAVSICICTFRRPRGLSRLLRSLERLDPATPSFEVIVVDNDVARTADAVVRAGYTFTLRYFVEPVQGIAHARSRSVREAASDFVAFIDDDEEADPGWLVELWRELQNSQATGVMGRVVCRFLTESPTALGPSLNFRPWQTGGVLRWFDTRTSSALVRRERMMRFPGPFDDAFDLTGGEDCQLFARMIEEGDTFVACESSVVYEYLPATRVTVRHQMKRSFIDGRIYGRVQFRSANFLAFLPQLIISLGHALAYSMAGLVVIPISRTAGFRCLQRAAGKMGIVTARMGIRIQRYQTVVDVAPAIATKPDAESGAVNGRP